ncbi:MAG: glycosyltransferase family 2 protein [Janthinobacterium lividum]
MAKISCFIIAKNEQERIAAAIKSVKEIVDEIIVVDSGSTDNTIAISESLGARVIFNSWPGYVAQKTFGESLCKNTWILNIDADEELTPDLRDEIEFIFRSNIQNRYIAYAINVTILHRNDRRPRFFAPVNKCIRIYNKKFCSYSNNSGSTTHDSVLFNKQVNIKDKIYNLNGIAYHRSGVSIEQLVTKANFYSTEQAADLVSSGRLPSKIRIIFEMILWFFKAYIIRRYIIFGFDGFVDSVIFAFTRFIRLAKAREKAKIEQDLR